jgi:hypothetical protein
VRELIVGIRSPVAANLTLDSVGLFIGVEHLLVGQVDRFVFERFGAYFANSREGSFVHACNSQIR